MTVNKCQDYDCGISMDTSQLRSYKPFLFVQINAHNILSNVFQKKASQHELNLTWIESVFMLCFIEQKASSTYALEGIVKDFVLIYLQRSLICYFVRLFNNELHIYIWCAWKIWYGFSGLTGRKVYAIFREVTLPLCMICEDCNRNNRNGLFAEARFPGAKKTWKRRIRWQDLLWMRVSWANNRHKVNDSSNLQRHATTTDCRIHVSTVIHCAIIIFQMDNDFASPHWSLHVSCIIIHWWWVTASVMVSHISSSIEPQNQ